MQWNEKHTRKWYKMRMNCIVVKQNNYIVQNWNFKLTFTWVTMEKLNESNLCAGLIDLPNIQLFIVIYAFVNLIWFEAFRCTTIHNLGDFGWGARSHHFLDQIVDFVGWWMYAAKKKEVKIILNHIEKRKNGKTENAEKKRQVQCILSHRLIWCLCQWCLWHFQ